MWPNAAKRLFPYQWPVLFKRLSRPATKIAKHAYNELNRLRQCGVKTWVTKARELVEQYEVDISSNYHDLKKYCKTKVSHCHKHSLLLEVTNLNRNPLRTFNLQNGTPR